MIVQADVQRLQARVAHYSAKQSAYVNDLRDLEREEAEQAAAHDRADEKHARDIAQAEHALELLIAKWDRPELPMRLHNGAYAPPSTTPESRAAHDERVYELESELEQLQRAKRHTDKAFAASAKQRVQLRESYERRLDAVAKKLEGLADKLLARETPLADAKARLATLVRFSTAFPKATPHSISDPSAHSFANGAPRLGYAQ